MAALPNGISPHFAKMISHLVNKIELLPSCSGAQHRIFFSSCANTIARCLPHHGLQSFIGAPGEQGLF